MIWYLVIHKLHLIDDRSSEFFYFRQLKAFLLMNYDPLELHVYMDSCFWIDWQIAGTWLGSWENTWTVTNIPRKLRWNWANEKALWCTQRNWCLRTVFCGSFVRDANYWALGSHSMFELMMSNNLKHINFKSYTLYLLFKSDYVTSDWRIKHAISWTVHYRLFHP